MVLADNARLPHTVPCFLRNHLYSIQHRDRETLLFPVTATILIRCSPTSGTQNIAFPICIVSIPHTTLPRTSYAVAHCLQKNPQPTCYARRLDDLVLVYLTRPHGQSTSRIACFQHARFITRIFNHYTCMQKSLDRNLRLHPLVRTH